MFKICKCESDVRKTAPRGLLARFASHEGLIVRLGAQQDMCELSSCFAIYTPVHLVFLLLFHRCLEGAAFFFLKVVGKFAIDRLMVLVVAFMFCYARISYLIA